MRTTNIKRETQKQHIGNPNKNILRTFIYKYNTALDSRYVLVLVSYNLINEILSNTPLCLEIALEVDLEGLTFIFDD